MYKRKGNVLHDPCPLKSKFSEIVNVAKTGGSIKSNGGPNWIYISVKYQVWNKSGSGSWALTVDPIENNIIKISSRFIFFACG